MSVNFMLFFAVLAVPISSVRVGVDGDRHAFNSHVAEHFEAMGTPEYEVRFQHYKKRVAAIQEHNSRHERTWTKGVNRFTAWTDEERADLFGWRGKSAELSFRSLSIARKRNKLPASVSWEHLNAVQDIQYQGVCASCWAITVTSTLTAHAEIYAQATNGLNRTFSTQELVDCVSNPHECGGQGGCRGATPELALAYTMMFGLAESSEYPYRGRQSVCSAPAAARRQSFTSLSADMENAQFGENAVGTHESRPDDLGRSFNMIGWVRLPVNERQQLMTALVEHGPVVVGVAAAAWIDYESGVFSGCSKDPVLDHVVVLVGYGSLDGVSHWRIQNSWSASWGDKGYFNLLRHEQEADEPCGIDHQFEKGGGCKGAPTDFPVCGECGIFSNSVFPVFGS